MNFELLKDKICNFMQNKVSNSNAKGVVFGLSGGIDSAVVATLCVDIFKEKTLALIMPTDNSNKENIKDALKLCNKLSLSYEIISIQSILDAFLSKCHDIDRIRRGNICARIRMSLLYDFSALKNYLVVGTSNKSELMLGYGTIYGDLAYAFNPIGELYKSDIFDFARFLNVPQVFIDKIPSADLYEGQSDEAELGFKYIDIDKVLKALENQKEFMIKDIKLLNMIKQRIKKNEFKKHMPDIFRDI